MKTETGEIIRQKRIEKDLTQVELEHKQRVDELFKKTGLFFAFSDEQFEKNKTPLLEEGEKYVSFGAGGYLPKHNAKIFWDEMDNITKWRKSETKKYNLRKKEIVKELYSHECFYTADLSDMYDIFPDVNRDLIYKIYIKEKRKLYKEN